MLVFNAQLGRFSEIGSLSADHQHIIEKLLQGHVDFLGKDGAIKHIEQGLVFDRDRDRNLLVETGWQNRRHIYGPSIHIDIKDDKVWIQHD